MPSPTDDLRELLAHDAWLRNLCARLVRDPSTADDLAQEAYLAALSAGTGQEVRSMRAWLAGIVRNLWRDGRRSAERRARRERAVARPEAWLDRSEHEAEFRPALAEALLALEDPLRRALILRFYGECTLQELAHREQISLSAAHARVERGLARLRLELDRSHDGARSAWGVLAARFARATAGAGPEVILMGSPWKLATLAALIGVVCLMGWKLARPSPASAESPATPWTRVGATAATRKAEHPVPTAERELWPAALAPGGELVLELRREPDRALLPFLPLEVEPASVSAGTPWLMSDEVGRVHLALPPSTSRLLVRASGFEEAQLELGSELREAVVDLRPTSGLHGRVLWPDGRPAAGAAVVLGTLESSCGDPEVITRSAPQVYLRRRWRGLCTASANARGEFYLAVDPATLNGAAELRAGPLDGFVALQSLSLPRPPGALEDLVLAPAQSLRLRVVDPAGRPIAGAEVGSRAERLLGRTDARGEIEVLEPLLPDVFSARAAGFRALGWRLDGREASYQDLVHSTQQRVELLLAPAPMARVRLVDSETGFPLFIGHGRVELGSDGKVTGASTFSPDRQGLALVHLYGDEDSAADLPPERVFVSFEKEGYDEHQRFELDPGLTPEDEPVVLAVDPLPGFRCLRGRVVRAGVAVPDLEVGLKAQRLQAAPGAGYAYHRAVTDEQGRFALRWQDEPGLSVTVHPHWLRWDEFGFIGPLRAELVGEEELLLELEPAVRVPAILRGVLPGVRYRYYVHVLDEQGRGVSTTINGAPLSLSGQGEVRTTLLLPSQCRVRVTIGCQADSYNIESTTAVAEHDPENSRGPLLFVVESPFVRASGRVEGVGVAERAELAVAFARRGDTQPLLTRVARDGTFSLSLRPGNGVLLLLKSRSGEVQAEALAQLDLRLDRDRTDLVLAPDPLSLPESRAR